LITTKILDSLASIKPESCPKDELKEYSFCKNEPFSFQLAFKITDDSEKSIPFFIKIISQLDINNYYVGYVPVIHTDFSVIEPKQPIGMYPDILIPKKTNPEIVEKEAWGNRRYLESGENTMLFAYNDSWQSVWFTVNENGKEMPAGNHIIKLELYNRNNELVGQSELTVDVIDNYLPEQSLIYTNWFHYDCIADYYNVEIFSERYYEIMRNFVRTAVKNGQNMLLLPAFTPPLDTAFGEERMTAQLVDIKIKNEKYVFDFNKLRCFIHICQEEGIKYFEHSHLFTQWGAKHAPKIVAEINGIQKQIFGWDTDSSSDRYIEFLRAYLIELKEVLKQENLEKNILFHISDEPEKQNYKNYEYVYGKIKDLLDDYMVGDALSEPEFYESGLVKIPIALTRRASLFKGDNIWCYYTGAEIYQGLSNRLIQLPRERNRFLGIQLYYHNIKGFLHWAYNFYYGELSNGMFNPFMNPCGGFPNAGTSYCVYPANDGTAYQSVRQKIFFEGITDIRALNLLESLSSRKECERIIESYFGTPDFRKCPDNPEILVAFRKAVNDKIKYFSQIK